MKIYRVHIRNASGRSVEYRYFASKREAKAYLRENTAKQAIQEGDLDTLSCLPTRSEILSTLNIYASHPDNGL